MNSNQRSQKNNQTSNGANEKKVSSARGGSGGGAGASMGSASGAPSRHTGDAEWGMSENRPRQAAGAASQQMAPGSRQLSGSTDSQNVDSTSRQGSQTGNRGYDDVGTQRYSNDSAGGLPRSPAGSRQSAETDLNDETGLSNSSNLQRQDQGTEQQKRHHVGRRDDLTED